MSARICRLQAPLLRTWTAVVTSLNFETLRSSFRERSKRKGEARHAPEESFFLSPRSQCRLSERLALLQLHLQARQELPPSPRSAPR